MATVADTTTTEVIVAPTKSPTLVPSPAHEAGPLAFLTDQAAFNHLWRIATSYARSQLIPTNFRGKTDDCFIACQLALRMGVDPFMLMQNMYVVHGRPGFEAKLAIALLNDSGKIKGTLKYTFDGDGDEYGARCWAIDADTRERVHGPKVDWRMVKAEGWNVDKKLRDGGGVQKSKWNTMPDMMFHYRAATFFIRTNYPEVLMGMRTVDELGDMEPQVLPADPEPGRSRSDSLAERLRGPVAGGNGHSEDETPRDLSGNEGCRVANASCKADEDPPFNPPTADDQADVLLTEAQEALAAATTTGAVGQVELWAAKLPEPPRSRVTAMCAKRLDELVGNNRTEASQDDDQPTLQSRLDHLESLVAGKPRGDALKALDDFMRSLKDEVDAGLCTASDQTAIHNRVLKLKADLGRKGGAK